MKKPVEILHVLHHDSCSSALDYAALMELLQRNFFQIDPEHIRFSILFIEFYGFNQFYGYNENLLERDQLLISKIGKKLSSALTENDMLVRVGDYQYIVVQADIPERVSSGLARQIMHLFSEPCMINGDMFYIYTSIGISFYPDEGTDLYALIKVAENKMKKVQKNGKNLISTVQDSSILLTERQMELKQALPAAIENGEIYFLYQAQYSQVHQRFTGAEMLARWKHPAYGEISPEIFIPLAEQNGMIASLSIKTLVAASKAFIVLDHAHIDDFSLSVNISPVFLLTAHFYKTLQFLLQEYELNERNLHFEITEEMLLEHTDYLLDILHKIKNLGICIEVDDFGTGYTSIRQLADLPIDILKIDKSFIQGIDTDKKKHDLLKAIVSMAEALNMKVIAEGIEKQEEATVLQQFTPLTIQGYLYAKPVQLEALVEKIQKLSAGNGNTL